VATVLVVVRHIIFIKKERVMKKVYRSILRQPVLFCFVKRVVMLVGCDVDALCACKILQVGLYQISF